MTETRYFFLNGQMYQTNQIINLFDLIEYFNYNNHLSVLESNNLICEKKHWKGELYFTLRDRYYRGERCVAESDGRHTATLRPGVGLWRWHFGWARIHWQNTIHVSKDGAKHVSFNFDWGIDGLGIDNGVAASGECSAMV